MSRKPSFAYLRTAAAAPAPALAGPIGQGSRGALHRPGEPPGPQTDRRLHQPRAVFRLAYASQAAGRSLQALMAEAFNDVLWKHGEGPIRG